jgi:hypothetical protein
LHQLVTETALFIFGLKQRIPHVQIKLNDIFSAKATVESVAALLVYIVPVKTVREIPEKLYVITSVVYFILKES